MKRNLFFGVFILLTFFFSQLSAQVIPPESVRPPGKASTTTSPPGSGKKAKKPKADKGSDGEATDVVTLNLTSLGLSNLSLRFEHRLKGKLSVGLGAGYLLSGILPNATPYDAFVSTNEFGIQPSSGEFSGFNATPEIRLYPFSKRGAPYGFYVSLFGRYFNYDWKVPYVSQDPNSGDKFTANGTFNVSGIGGGTTLGAQFLIKDRVVIDWFFLGGGVASSTLSGEVTSPDITDDLAYYEDLGIDIKSFYGGIPSFNEENLTVNFEKEKASFELKNQLLPIFRVGLAIGIAF
jgi:hypothetical protein